MTAFADNNLNMAAMMKCVSHSIGDIVGKGENTGYQHFLLFSQGFPKASS